VLDWNFSEPKIEWFKGAKLNITENCIDRHLENMGDKPAIIWEPNNPEDREQGWLLTIVCTKSLPGSTGIKEQWCEKR
jgi:hypothetical protein